MKIKFTIMRTISKSCEIILFLLLVLVPCSVYADDFEDDFIDVELFEQDNEIDNKSDEDFWNVDKAENEGNLSSDEENLITPSPDPDQAYAEKDPETPQNETKLAETEENDNLPGTSRDSKENDEASAESLDYSEDLNVIINLLQNVQFTMMIVCGIIIGFFFITRLLP